MFINYNYVLGGFNPLHPPKKSTFIITCESKKKNRDFVTLNSFDF